MRLFTAIAIPNHVVGCVEQTLRLLRPSADLRWTPAVNLHITTKFIGPWPEAMLPRLQQALAAVDVPGNLEITISGFGYYPNPHRPKSFFAGVRAPGLYHLNRALDEILEPLGCPRQASSFSPHLTLARINRQDVGQLRERITTLHDFYFGVFIATEFHLYQSTAGTLGSVYTPLASWPLTSREPLAQKEVVTC